MAMRILGLIFFIALATGIATSDGNAQQRQVPETRAQVQLSYAPLVEKAAPAVVNIYTQKIVANRQVPPLFDDPFFRRFFGDLGFRFNRGGPRREQQNSLGSGVIVSPEGLVVTNQHVIEGADKIIVVLADKREFEAQIVVSDDKTDLSVLRVDPGGEPLPALEIRDSDELKVGDLVLAIGNPFGVGQTVTSGIVSALARAIGNDTELKSFIQTDAAINPGNSGGALLSMDGKLVGINTSIFSKSGGSHGIGFAVPSNMVRAVVYGISENGKLVRPWLGAIGQAVTSDIALSLGMKRPQGVIVSQVHKSGSAALGGLRAGDVVLAVNGHEIAGTEDLQYRVATLPVGDRAVLRVMRGQNVLPITVEMQPAPDTPEPDTTELEGRNPLSGSVVANLSPALAEEYNIDPFGDGVVILRIRRGGIANRLDFRPGDIVRQINGIGVPSVTKLEEIVRDEAKAEWRIRVERAGQTFDFVFKG
ncbi:MAG: Do family serine endopeptidase [Rhodospirillales bacterium]|nr:Do family serine endopeptidase [Rhodospirillales bacterium]MBO6786424.1 Do family serine endopeptidase [Rhodospirillales bacterium]